MKRKIRNSVSFILIMATLAISHYMTQVWGGKWFATSPTKLLLDTFGFITIGLAYYLCRPYYRKGIITLVSVFIAINIAMFLIFRLT